MKPETNAGHEPRTETDASHPHISSADLPDEVYRPTASGGNHSSCHVDQDCEYLARANNYNTIAIEDIPPAWREWCPGCASEFIDRIPEREELVTDGGIAAGYPGHGNGTPTGLTTFQWDILAALAREGPSSGQSAKDVLDGRYGREVNHGRLYPNLDDLIDQGLLVKHQRDGRTNEYALTDRGARELTARLNWLADGVQAAADGGDQG
jgi:DNA-binding PadR family transcriptional regulator